MNTPGGGTLALIVRAMPPRPFHCDPSLKREGDWRMMVRKGKVETGNAGSFDSQIGERDNSRQKDDYHAMPRG